jgi:hypothetical protein
MLSKTLLEKQHKLFDVIGLWDNPRDWMNRYNETKNWINTNGCLPSSESNDVDEKFLGVWCQVQRARRRGTAGKSKALSIDQIALLEDLDGWFWDIDHSSKFSRMIQDSKLYIEANQGHPSCVSKNETTRNLGLWMSRQRLRRSTLSKDQIKQLESLPGWYWNKIDLIQKGLRDIRLFVLKYDRFPSRYSENKQERQMGERVSTLKRAHKSKTLTKYLVEEAENIPGWEWTKTEKDTNKLLNDKWIYSRNQLHDFVKRNHAFPSNRSKNEEERRLAAWTNTQKQGRKGKTRARKLTPTQIKQLEQIPGWFW